ncbi:unnamed protein product, partial [marine sediment metagenome]
GMTVTPEVTKITEEIDKLTGVEKTYWDSANKKLTVYYNPETTMERARIEVANYLARRQLQASVEQTVFISTEKGTFKPKVAIPKAMEGMPEAIPTELQPLAEEARKFKSAGEFETELHRVTRKWNSATGRVTEAQKGLVVRREVLTKAEDRLHQAYLRGLEEVGRYTGAGSYADFYNLVAKPPAVVTPITPEVTKLTGDIWDTMFPMEREQLGIKAGLSAEERGSRWIGMWPEKKRALIREFKKEQVAIPKAEAGMPVKGEQAGMLGVPGKYVEQKRPWTPGQMGFES